MSIVSKKKQLNNSRLYLILDKATCGKKDMGMILKKAILGGVDIVQFRDKISPTKTMIRDAYHLLKIAKKSGIPFIINDRLDIALAIDADGVHLGQDDMPVKTARKILGVKKIIGLSCHNISDIKRGEREKADYLGLGPVFHSQTKNIRAPIGPTTFKKALKKAHLPLFAIGGITENNLKKMGVFDKLKNEAPRAKARGFLKRNTERPLFIRTLKGAISWPRMYKFRIAASRELCLSPNPARTAKRLKDSLK